MTPRKHSIDASGALLLVACSGLMGLNQVAIKLTNAGIHPVFQAGLRSALAILPIWIYARYLRKPLSISDGSLLPGIAAGLFFAFEFFLLYQALEYTSVSRASIFFYTMPFWAAIGAHFLIPNEKLTLLKSAGMLLAFLGILMAFATKHDSSLYPNALQGDLYCLVGSMLWAGIILLARASGFSRACPEMQLLYQLTVSAIVLAGLSLLFEDPIRILTPTIGLLMLFQVLIVVCLGFLAWFWLLSVYPSAIVASYSFLSPVFGVVFGWLILDETLDRYIVGALLFVSMGVYLVNRPDKPVAHTSDLP